MNCMDNYAVCKVGTEPTTSTWRMRGSTNWAATAADYLPTFAMIYM